MTTHILNGLRSAAYQRGKVPNRPLFYWLTVIFNSVDLERIKQVGPDRACAEWLLRNGASVRWKGFPEYLKDYNALQIKQTSNYIEAVYAEECGISHVGFPYFAGCKYIEEIKLVNCKYIDNRAIPLLSILKDSLTNLEIKDCKSVDDTGLQQLKTLKSLKELKIEGLSYVMNKDSIYKELTQALPNCKIEFL